MSTLAESVFLVARAQHTIYVRALGMANMTNAPVLETFLLDQLADGLDLVCVDLSACTGMDSTFMGTLVGFHHRLAPTAGRIIVINPTPSNLSLLNMLGVSAVIPVLENQSMPEVPFVRLDIQSPMSAVDRALMMQRAHQSLTALSEDNQAKFAPFLAALEADLARHQKKEGTQE